MGNMDDNRYRTVSETAQLFGLTVRTLHYWDEIHLLCPRVRSSENARLYTAQDIEKIQHIVIYRAAGFTLKDIKHLLDDPTADLFSHLERQRAELLKKQNSINTMLTALDRLAANLHGGTMNTDHIDPAWGRQYEAEAQERWGGTDDWGLSQEVRKAMTPSDQEAYAQKTRELENRLAQAVRQKVEPSSSEAQELAEEHRLLLSHWFPVTHSKHVLIARSYTADPRFADHYDGQEPGLTDWLVSAITANATAHGVDIKTAEWV